MINLSFDPNDWNPFDPIGHFDDYVMDQMWLDTQEERRKQEADEHKRQLKLRAYIQALSAAKMNATDDLKRYMAELTPRERFDLETLLVRLNIIVSESDSIDSVNTDNESASKFATVKTTVVDESESVEQDLEKYLSKLTTEKREELEDILNRFKKASAKLDELKIMINPAKKTELSPIGYIIAVILTLIITFPLWYSIFV